MRLKNTYLYKSGMIYSKYDNIGQEMNPVLTFRDRLEFDTMFDYYKELDDIDGWMIVRDILEKTIICSEDSHWLAWEDCSLWLVIQDDTLVLSTELFRPTNTQRDVMLSGDTEHMIGCAIDIATQAMSIVYDAGFFFVSELGDSFHEEDDLYDPNDYIRVYRRVPEGKSTFNEWSAGLMMAYLNFSSDELLGVFANNGGEENE